MYNSNEGGWKQGIALGAIIAGRTDTSTTMWLQDSSKGFSKYIMVRIITRSHTFQISEDVVNCWLQQQLFLLNGAGEKENSGLSTPHLQHNASGGTACFSLAEKAVACDCGGEESTGVGGKMTPRASAGGAAPTTSLKCKNCLSFAFQTRLFSLWKSLRLFGINTFLFYNLELSAC